MQVAKLRKWEQNLAQYVSNTQLSLQQLKAQGGAQGGGLAQPQAVGHPYQTPQPRMPSAGLV